MKSPRPTGHAGGASSPVSGASIANRVATCRSPRFSVGRVALLLLAAVVSLPAAEFYVTPGGTSSGDGSVAKPWDLPTALNQPSAVKPGDTIWLRGGTYQVGSKPYRFNSALAGTASAPITVRNYNNERAIIDGNLQAWAGGNVTFWGLEITDSWPGRTTSESGPWPQKWLLANGAGQATDYCVSGADLRVANVKMINCLLHDNIGGGFGMTTAASNCELYGCLSYFNGWQGSDRGHGHGAYLQGTGTTKITDCIFFNNADHGMQIYGSAAVTLSGYQLTGNFLFDNGSLFPGSTSGRNLLLGGSNVSPNNALRANTIYRTVGTLPVLSDLSVGYIGGTAGLVLASNTFVCSMLFNIGTDSTIFANTFLGSLLGLAPATYPANTFATTRPTTGAFAVVRPNLYEAGRGQIAIGNWQGLATVNVDISSLGGHAGDTFELHNAQDYFGDVQSFTYATSTLAVPMTGHTVAKPAGGAPVSTFPAFGAFVLIKTSRGSGPASSPPATGLDPTPPPPDPPPVPSPTSAAPGPTISVTAWTTLGDLPLLPANVAASFQLEDTNSLAAKAFTWDFGDGTTSTLAQPVHSFTDCGPYPVLALVNDGLTVQAAQLLVSVPCQLSIQQILLQAYFRGTSADRCKLTASVSLDANFNPAGQPVTVSVGGGVITFTLNARGIAAGSFGNARLTYSRSAKTWRLVANLRQSGWDQSWANQGLINANVAAPGATVRVPVIVAIGEEVFADEPALHYVAQLNQNGVAH